MRNETNALLLAYPQIQWRFYRGGRATPDVTLPPGAPLPPIQTRHEICIATARTGTCRSPHTLLATSLAQRVIKGYSRHCSDPTVLNCVVFCHNRQSAGQCSCFHAFDDGFKETVTSVKVIIHHCCLWCEFITHNVAQIIFKHGARESR